MDKTDYIYVGRYKSPLIYHYICLPSPQAVNAEPRLLPLDNGLILDGYCFFLKSQWEGIKENTVKAAGENNSVFFTDLFTITEKKIKDSLAICKKIDGSWPVSVDLAKEFFDSLHSMNFPWWYTLPVGDGLEIVLKEKLANGEINQETIESFFELEKPTFLMQQKQEMQSIKEKLDVAGLLSEVLKLPPADAMSFIQSHSPELYSEIRNHVQKFKWFGMMHFWGEPFNEEKFFWHLGLLKPVEKIEKVKPRLPNELEWLKHVSSELCYWRQMCADTCAVASYTVYSKLGRIGKEQMHLSYDLASYLTPPEFLDAMQGKPIPGIGVLNERKKAFGVLTNEKNTRVVTGLELKQLLGELLDEVNETSLIQGTTASKGFARGPAKIVFSPDQVSKVKKGDVLVAPETTPDFMAGVYLAKAIVTDIGGISSHAAIISRELGIPCIVGTKTATRMLKDGDLVEVDATRGVVKRISPG